MAHRHFDQIKTDLDKAQADLATAQTRVSSYTAEMQALHEATQKVLVPSPKK